MREIDIFEVADPSIKWAVDSYLGTIETDACESEVDELIVQWASENGYSADDLMWCEA